MRPTRMTRLTLKMFKTVGIVSNHTPTASVIETPDLASKTTQKKTSLKYQHSNPLSDPPNSCSHTQNTSLCARAC